MLIYLNIYILEYYKINSSKFPVLSLIARRYLGILTTLVAISGKKTC